jgi:NAD(P)-dependent dehydrogenase (short-subunit alcohol dehydrogenase family)
VSFALPAGRLTGRTALVTGGATGIGAAIARRLAGEGAAVVVMGRRAAPLREVAASLPEGRGHAIPGDATSEEDVARAVAGAVALQGRLDVVVNNAGAGGGGSVTDVTPAAWREALEVNLTSAFLVLRASAGYLRAVRGNAVNVSSVAGLRAGPEVAAYATAKAGLVMLTRQAALDLGPDVRVNAVCPGWVRTPMADGEMDELAAMRGGDREAAYAACVAPTPLRRAAAPEEVAAAVAFLAGDDASFITGVALPVDGGSTIVDVATLPFSDA